MSSHVPNSYESPWEIFQKIFIFIHKVMLTLTYSWPSGSIIGHNPYQFAMHVMWKTNWSLLGPGVELGLTPNCMKNIHIFPLLIIGSFFFFFLPSKLDVQCMGITKKEQNKILFQNLFKLMFNWYNKQCKVGEGHFNSFFNKKSKFYKVCIDFKSNVCFIIMVGFENWNTKIQLIFIGIWIAY
jgi:hypothetical protein